MIRSILLRMSRSRFLEDSVARRPVMRRAVRRFLAGETMDEALRAAAALRSSGLGVVITRLGENVRDAPAASAAVRHYVDLLAPLAVAAPGGGLSVKPTHLGLDLGMDVVRHRMDVLLEAAQATGTMVWVDMEDSSYVDRTLALVRHARQRTGLVGVCLQAYLHRTPEDLGGIMASGTRVRLVKGAYQEPASVALRSRAAVDRQFLDLATRILTDTGYTRAAPPVFGTHDHRVLDQVREIAARQQAAAPCEYHLLYGVRPDLQNRLAAAGESVSVLVSYGERWFPWYMRRLAERPANLWFVVRQLGP
jgi:proline dehydrogenase